ncbi:uncharacterized protein LOC110019026 [Phalaenopsis equestris]|uniref:uncharacterized protein LOC110019026 n=1 Tax=Phalaenopsis equestris TaxID=78828 RepID=UPI0009E4E600|nr:uncharacterized protein LOC110019026 [Phalaenopsis equestris]
MALILDALIEILRKPTIGDMVSELTLFAAPLWLAVFVGLVVGWVWRPRWAAGLVGEGEGCSCVDHPVKPMLNSHGSRLKLALPSLDSLRDQIPSRLTFLKHERMSEKEAKTVDLSSPHRDKKELAVTSDDLQKLYALVETTDGGPAWIPMMEKSLPTMSYQAWRRDPETGPPQYRSRSVFEDVTPELVRDFFWDDEFRIKNKWDDMLLYQAPLEECSVTGTMMVHWIRKFPFFCSDREYTIGRRIWEVDGAYYCVTKGVPFPSLPRQNKPRRVDLYYSSWCIRSVESRRGDNQKTACEVLLFHYEDMGIPWEIAKLGVRQGMWGCVKKIEPGLRAYQATRKSDEPLSRCAAVARINTKISFEHMRLLGNIDDTLQDIVDVEEAKEKPWQSNLPKFLLVGGAVALACTLDRGLLTKAVIFGVARRFAKIGKRL